MGIFHTSRAPGEYSTLANKVNLGLALHNYTVPVVTTIIALTKGS